MSKISGKIAQVIGPVVDIKFDGNDNQLPKSMTLLKLLEIMEKDSS